MRDSDLSLARIASGLAVYARTVASMLLTKDGDRPGPAKPTVCASDSMCLLTGSGNSSTLDLNAILGASPNAFLLGTY